jgi:hypothetical protein
MLDPNLYQDPDSMNEFNESVSTTLISDPLFQYVDPTIHFVAYSDPTSVRMRIPYSSSK